MKDVTCAKGVKHWRPTPFIVFSMLLHMVVVASWLLLPSRWPLWIALIVLNHLALAAIGLWPRSHWLGANWTRLPAAATARREIAITIDDGPDPDVTPRVLDILARENAVATFFCIGARAQQYAELCAEIVRRGHAVENHSQRHSHLFSLWGYRSMRDEIATAQTTFSALVGIAPKFFRAPAGLRNPFLAPALAHCDLQLAAWTRRGFDTQCGDPEIVLQRLTRNLRAGDILLLHDGHAARTQNGEPVIIAVLPKLLAAIRAAGLTPVTLRTAQE